MQGTADRPAQAGGAIIPDVAMDGTPMTDRAPATSSPGRVLAGLIGRGIQLSRSPGLHEAEADAQGLRLLYRLFDFAANGLDTPDLPRLLDALQLTGFAGVNVTYPYKQAIVPLLDDLSPEAARIGAVNTVGLRDGRRIGYNTDVTGFAENLRRGLPDVPVGCVVQAGSGGAGAATAHALLGLGTGQLRLFDTDPARAQALCESLCAIFGAGRATVTHDPEAAMREADGLVNATPMGTAQHPGSAISPALLRPHHWVADIVYFPLETELLRAARAIGCRTLDGGGMAVFQAAGAFEIFTGRAPDADRMLRSFHAIRPSA